MGQREVRDRLSWEPGRVTFTIITTNPANISAMLTKHHVHNFFYTNSLNTRSSPTNNASLDFQLYTGHGVTCSSVEPGFRTKDLFAVPRLFHAVVCSVVYFLVMIHLDCARSLDRYSGCVEGAGLAVEGLNSNHIAVIH